jgi:hypothetical protein
MSENKDIVKHRLVVDADWSISEQSFVEFHEFHFEGGIDKLAGLLNAIGQNEPAVKALFKLIQANTRTKMRTPDNYQPNRPIKMGLKADEEEEINPHIESSQKSEKIDDVDDMSDEDVKAMIRRGLLGDQGKA